MKRILLFLAAAVAALALSSCDKENTVINDEKQDLNLDMVLDITVSNIDGAPDEVDTKAMKNGWVTDDRIFIWYDDNQQERPDLVIKRTVTYSSTRPYYSWSIDTEADVSGNIPGASGTLKCLFVGGNALSAYDYKTSQVSGSVLRAWFEGSPELTFTSDPDSPISYTYSSKTIKFDISAWKPCSELQVVISGIPASIASNYRLKAKNLLGMDGFFIRADRITAHGNTADRYVEGVSNSDGVAFYFSGTVNPSVKQDYVFYLENKMTGDLETYTVKERTHSDKGFEALKISHSKFNGLHNGHEFVDLGFGTKWATMNVGATSMEKYGSYYQWAGTEDVTNTSMILDWTRCPYHTGSSPLTGWTKYIFYKPTYWSGPGSQDDKVVLDIEDDAANYAWGGKWRTPTSNEWDALVAYCTFTWTTINGVEGYKVQSTLTGYTDKWIFLPSGSGYRDSNTISYFGDSATGHYWSSSLYNASPQSAYSMYIANGVSTTSYSNRKCGIPIRAVFK